MTSYSDSVLRTFLETKGLISLLDWHNVGEIVIVIVISLYITVISLYITVFLTSLSGLGLIPQQSTIS